MVGKDTLGGVPGGSSRRRPRPGVGNTISKPEGEVAQTPAGFGVSELVFG